jgi:hypothetical protein
VAVSIDETGNQEPTAAVDGTVGGEPFGDSVNGGDAVTGDADVHDPFSVRKNGEDVPDKKIHWDFSFAGDLRKALFYCNRNGDMPQGGGREKSRKNPKKPIILNAFVIE